jgi:SPP1 gp7 family putative phage head morphogenesis protein
MAGALTAPGRPFADRIVVPGRAIVPGGRSPIRLRTESIWRELGSTELRTMAPVLRRLDGIWRDLDANLRAVGEAIDAARAAGDHVYPTWLYNERRFQKLVADYERQMLALTEDLKRRVAQGQADAVAQALRDAPKTLASVADQMKTTFPEAAGNISSTAIAEAFDTVGPGVLSQTLAQTAEGTPLAALIAEIAPTFATQVTGELTAGIVQGRSVADMVRNVRRIAQAPATRIRTIVRTETLRAYRESTRAIYDAADVVDGWIWHSATDATTCPVCWALHGSEHETTEVMGTHPNCRCTMLPKVKSWDDLSDDLGLTESIDELPTNFEPAGSDLFAKLTPAEQKGILGPARFEAYKNGELTLESIPRATTSRFGPGVRSANLDELGLSHYGPGGDYWTQKRAVGKPKAKPKPSKPKAIQPENLTDDELRKRANANMEARLLGDPEPYPGLKFRPADTRRPAWNQLDAERASKALRGHVEDMAEELRAALPEISGWPQNVAYGKIGGPQGWFTTRGLWPPRRTKTRSQDVYDNIIAMDVRYEPTAATTYLHEFGHWLDLAYASTNHPGRPSLIAALRGSDRYLAIKAARTAETRGIYRRHLAYVLRDRECIARAFTQYMGTRPGASAAAKAAWKRQIDAWSGNGSIYYGEAYYWEPEDFKPIAKAIEAWLKAIGVQ